MEILIAFIAGGIVGAIAVGLFNKPNDRTHYADTAYKAMTEYGLSRSTAELIRQRIEELLTH